MAWKTAALRGTLIAALAVPVVACAPGAAQLRTPHYSLSYPDYWKLKATGTKDGEPTLLVITPYGDTAIDAGSGAVAPTTQNYDAVTADIEVRLYGWNASVGPGTASQAVFRRLAVEPQQDLSAGRLVMESPPECGMFRKTYRLFGVDADPVDLLRRPGWRVIVVGATSGATLVGVVARVEAEQDVGRFCHNLRNMQVQLQNLLDNLSPGAGVAASAGP